MRAGVFAPVNVFCQRPRNDRLAGGDLFTGTQARFPVALANTHLALDDPDAYLLRHILHNWDDERAVTILRNVRRATGEAGRLLVVERVIEPGNGQQFGKLMDLTMLVVHGGAERTEEQFRGLLEAGGFRLRRIVPTAVEVSVIEGEPV